MSGPSFNAPVSGYNTLAGINVSDGGTFNANFNYTPPGPRSHPYRFIPFSRNEEIVLRPDLVEKVHTLLPSTTGCHSAALWGFGGAGKTQIALQYAYSRCDDPTYSVFWVHADDENTFQQDYKTIARKFGIDSRLRTKELLLAVRDRIELEPAWLLVLDNADDLALFGIEQGLADSNNSMHMFDYIPTSPSGTVLWTSRDERIVGTLVGPGRGIQVSKMTIDEGMLLLETAKNDKIKPRDLESARKLLGELDQVPLAIYQAGAYMQRTSCPIQEYLSNLTEGKQIWAMLKKTEFDRHRRAEVPNSILEIWSLSISRMRQQSEMAYRILNILAYLDNQNIPIEVIERAARYGSRDQSTGEIQRELDQAVIRLKEFSFLQPRETEEGEHSFQMHKLLQEASRYYLATKQIRRQKCAKESILQNIISKALGRQSKNQKSQDLEGDQYFCRGAVLIMRDLFPRHPNTQEAFKLCEKYLSSAIRVCDYLENSEKPGYVSSLLSDLGVYFYNTEREIQSEKMILRSLELQRCHFGEKDPDTLSTMGNLAMCYREQGRAEEAEKIEVQLLTLQKEVLGEKHAGVANLMLSHAATLKILGRYEDAKKMSKQAVELYQDIFGDDHPDTIEGKRYLGGIYFLQGHVLEAEQLLIPVLAQSQKEMLKTHAATARSLWVLSEVYEKQGRYHEAEEVIGNAIKILKTAIGDGHPETIRAMAARADILEKQDRREEAISLVKECCYWGHKTLGPLHKLTNEVDEHLSRLLQGKGE